MPPGRLAPWLLACAFACGAEAPPPLAGMELLARVEARLEMERAALRPRLSHYGLVFPVEPDELARFMRQIRVHGEGGELALGTAFALESHGGGLLRLLFDHWRPAARPPRQGDRYPFEGLGGSRRPPTLGQLYGAARARLFLPRDEPAEPPRLRTRFALPGGPLREIESDAWKLVSLALELEPDLERGWPNQAGERLSVERLLERVRAAYLASPAHRVEPADHSKLHLVELLVAHAARAPAPDLAAVQRHFLDVELAARGQAPQEAALLLAHDVESLAQLLGAPGLRWSEADRARVRAWLAELETERLRDVGAVDLSPLSHLAHGLRGVRERRAVLE